MFFHWLYSVTNCFKISIIWFDNVPARAPKWKGRQIAGLFTLKMFLCRVLILHPMKVPIRLHALFILIALLLPLEMLAQLSRQAILKSSIQRIIDTSRGRIGIGIAGLDFKDSLSFNGKGRFPMQSVFELPLAIAVLDAVDRGRLALTQVIHIPAASLDKDTWGPLVRDFPARDIDITLADLLRYSISKSDNNACDALFKLYNGTGAVNNFIHRAGISGMAVAATEGEMKRAWSVQYTNWCQPDAMLQLLRLFYEGMLLRPASNKYLMKLMKESENPSTRIKGMLPANAVVAHKTGSSNTNAQGIKAATNDVGIITLPDGRHYALVVFVSDYPGGNERGEQMIAQISRLVWDYFTAK